MLSATAVAQARPKAQQYRLWDERSLYLLVMPNGRRYWRLNHRFKPTDFPGIQWYRIASRAKGCDGHFSRTKIES